MSELEAASADFEPDGGDFEPDGDGADGGLGRGAPFDDDGDGDLESDDEPLRRAAEADATTRLITLDYIY